MNKRIAYCAMIVMAAAGTARAQTNDAMEIDELRETVARQELLLADISQRLAELGKAGTNAPIAATQKTWTEKVKISGDVRLRYERTDGEEDKSRMRFRARVGINGDITDEVYSGIRIASGDKGRATSTNQDFNNWASGKVAWIDLAYIGYTPLYAKGLNFSVGKIEKPWIDVDSMIWDGDVNPEGFAAVYSRDIGAVNLFAHAGYFIMNEDINDDVDMTTAQLAGKVKINDTFSLRIGSTANIWGNIDGATAPAKLTNGNSYTTNSTGDRLYATGFQTGELFTDLTVRTKPAEFKLYGEALKNFDAIDQQDSAWLLGCSAKRGKTTIKYSYRNEQNNSIVAFFTDSDMAHSSICNGHMLSARYDFTKHLYLNLACNLAETYAGTDESTLLIDCVVKF